MLLRHRRLLSLSLVTILTLLLAEALPHPAKPPLLGAFLLLAAVFFALSRKYRPALVHALALLLAAVAIFSSARLSAKREALAPTAEETLSLSVTLTHATVSAAGETSGEGYAQIPTEEGDVGARVKVKAPTAAKAGDVLFGSATIYPTESGSAAAAQGFLATVDFDSSVRVTGKEHSPIVLLGQLREWLCDRIHAVLSGEEGALFAALLLGEREGLSPSFSRDMSRIGTSHILSLSGLHLVVLTAGLAMLLRHMRVGYRLRFFLLSLFSLFFVFLTGFSPSVMRAGFMFAIAALPLFLREEQDSLSALFAAVALILLFTPYAAGDLGLWLSALATLGILLLFDRIRFRTRESLGRFGGVVRLITVSLAVTLTATVATLPLTLIRFGTLPLLSPIANLLLGPLTQLSLYLAAFVMLFGAFPPLVYVSECICKAIFAISGFLADIPRTVLGAPSGGYLILPILLSLLILLYFCFCPRRRFRVFLPILLLFATFASLLFPPMLQSHGRADDVTVTRYTEGGSDCLYAEDGETHVLIPLGDGGLTRADKAALAHAVGEADILFLPYYPRSTAYATAFLTEYKMRTLLLPLPANARERAAFTEILAVAQSEGVGVKTFRKTPVPLGSLTLSELILIKDGEGKTRVLLTLSHAGRAVTYYDARENEGLPPDYRLPSGAVFIGDGSLSLGKKE